MAAHKSHAPTRRLMEPAANMTPNVITAHSTHPRVWYRNSTETPNDCRAAPKLKGLNADTLRPRLRLRGDCRATAGAAEDQRRKWPSGRQRIGMSACRTTGTENSPSYEASQRPPRRLSASGGNGA